jgi:hypothetical protein
MTRYKGQIITVSNNPLILYRSMYIPCLSNNSLNSFSLQPINKSYLSDPDNS